MTGKLRLAQGEDYGFYPRRAKAVAEAIDFARANGSIVDCSAVPDPIPAGGTTEITWTDSGGAQSVSGTTVVETTKEGELLNLAASAQLLPTIAVAVATEGLDIAIVPTADGAPLTDPLCTYTPPEAGQFTTTPIGPYPSPDGAPFWFRRNPRTGNVQVGFDIDTDPSPDVWSSLLAFIANEEVDQNYRNDVRAQALSLGWDGVIDDRFDISVKTEPAIPEPEEQPEPTLEPEETPEPEAEEQPEPEAEEQPEPEAEEKPDQPKTKGKALSLGWDGVS